MFYNSKIIIEMDRLNKAISLLNDINDFFMANRFYFLNKCEIDDVNEFSAEINNVIVEYICAKQKEIEKLYENEV